ncbi:C39 family peptidase [Pontiellaceae bacterium B12219]|nr:C39 family peptidase [Pontiellaceae bacterium B12219]
MKIYRIISFHFMALGFLLLSTSIVEAASVVAPPVTVSGTSSNDVLTGTSGNDVIDGGEGADTMTGLAGDDLYYVDNKFDVVIEQPDEGYDIVELNYCNWTNYGVGLEAEIYQTPTNVEKVVMGYDAFDVVEMESGLMAHVYGDPLDWRGLLDDNQFDNASNLVNTCTMASIANVMTMLGSPTTEEKVLAYMLANNLVGIPSKGDTPPAFVETALENGYGCSVTRSTVLPVEEVAEFLKNGHAIIMGVDYGVVNEGADPRDYDDHAITLTGVAFDAVSGEVAGFYYCDSGDEDNPSGASFMSTNLYYEAHAQYTNAQILVIDAPLKVQRDNFRVNRWDVSGGIIIGNRGDNVVVLTNGNDYVEGNSGDDLLADESGGNDVFVPGVGNDEIVSKVGADYFIFSVDGGDDRIFDKDTESDWVAFDASVDSASIFFAYDGADLTIGYDSNATIQVVDYAGFRSVGIRRADGFGIGHSALSNLVEQMEAYCIANSVDFTDLDAVRADSGLAALISGSWQVETSPIPYRAWAVLQGISHEEQDYAVSPAGDGIGNLLKYAAGLDPLVSYSLTNLYTYASDSSEQRFKMTYQQSKRSLANFVAEWTPSLTNAWTSSGVELELLDESLTDAIWEASLPLGQVGFMRLRAELNE